MLLMKYRKDGGQESNVDGFFIIEIKSLFSIVFLKFNKGARENYHSHAFNAYSWYLKGHVTEYSLNPETKSITQKIWKGLNKLKFTPKSQYHKVVAHEDTYCLTFRGPWDNTWQEYNQENDKFITLTHGRRIVE